MLTPETDPTLAYMLGQVDALRAQADAVRTTETLFLRGDGSPVRMNDLLRETAARIEAEAKARYGEAWAEARTPGPLERLARGLVEGLIARSDTSSSVPPVSDTRVTVEMPDTTAPADREKADTAPVCPIDVEHDPHLMPGGLDWACDGHPVCLSHCDRVGPVRGCPVHWNPDRLRVTWCGQSNRHDHQAHPVPPAPGYRPAWCMGYAESIGGDT